MTHIVHLASPEFSFQAIMVNLGYSVQENWAAFNATNYLLMETHWTLLEGATAKTPYPAVNAARPGSAAVVRCSPLWCGVLDTKGPLDPRVKSSLYGVPMRVCIVTCFGHKIHILGHLFFSPTAR